MTVIGKYLKTYGEPEIIQLMDFPRLNWDYSLLIPAYGEPGDFFERLEKGLLKNHAVLLIVIINQPENSINSEHAANNIALKTHFHQSGQLYWQRGELQLIRLNNSDSAILVVDRFSDKKIPEKQGVGLARKIAADLATALIKQKRLASPWLFCTDADSCLPKDYFLAVDTVSNKCAALIYPFRHDCEDDALGRATRLYEGFLHHYVDGLKAAGSPYAFHTIGSIMAVHHRHYAMVRGFPKRAGGEDFYLLNKLAKTGEVISLPHPSIDIRARISQRVPFGTGPAVDKILAMANPEKEFKVQNPQVFVELKTWLSAIPRLWEDDNALAELADTSRHLLLAMGVEHALNHSRQHSNSSDAFAKQMHIWFDGFKTLKYLNGLRAEAFPDICLTELTHGRPDL